MTVGIIFFLFASVYIKYENLNEKREIERAADIFETTVYKYTAKSLASKKTFEIKFDYLKKEKHLQKVDLETLDLFATKTHQGNLEETYLVKERIQELLFAVQNAKSSYGQVFWLRAYEEMSFKEIGKILGKSENWARVNYYRAKEWIRRRMESDENNL